MAPQPPVRTHVNAGGAFGGDRNHHGIDLYAKRCDEVHASFFGRVIETGWSPTYGNYVIVKHRSLKGVRRTTLYGHLEKITTKKGRYVNSRSVIGLAGDSGAAKGVHVHFGCYENAVAVDPLTWVTL
jgi:murein DD-endopeptidase MepM/ murein hydrolase activator NlpD